MDADAKEGLRPIIIAKLLTSVLIAVGVALVLGYLARSAALARPAMDPRTGARTFTFVRGYRVFAVLWLLIAAFFAVPTLQLFKEDSPDAVWFLGISIVFAAVSFYCLAETLLRRVIVTGESITGISPWTRPRTFTWQEIRSISYSAPSKGYFLTGPDGKIFVGDHFGGAGELMAELEKRVPAERWERRADR